MDPTQIARSEDLLLPVDFDQSLGFTTFENWTKEGCRARRYVHVQLLPNAHRRLQIEVGGQVV